MWLLFMSVSTASIQGPETQPKGQIHCYQNFIKKPRNTLDTLEMVLKTTYFKTSSNSNGFNSNKVKPSHIPAICLSVV